jgi:hypothetical protein
MATELKTKKQKQNNVKFVSGVFLFECKDIRDGCKTIHEGCDIKLAGIGGNIRILGIHKVGMKKVKGKQFLTFNFVGKYDIA